MFQKLPRLIRTSVTTQSRYLISIGPSIRLVRPFGTYTSRMSSNKSDGKVPTSGSDNTTKKQDAADEQHHPPLPLPAPEDTSATTTIDISDGSGTVKLDHLGPLVVNTDGTLSRIANWEQMTEIEKKNTLRILTKRNKLRMESIQNTGEGVGGEKKE